MRFNTLILLFGFVFSYNAISQEVKGRSKPQSLNISNTVSIVCHHINHTIKNAVKSNKNIKIT